MKTVVLLAAFQGEKYLPALLASLFSQTRQDFQVLFQDDGSSDNTPALLASIASRDPRFIPGKEQGLHLGPVGNFLSLLHQADADYIFLCDQDDIWEPDKISQLTESMKAAELSFGPESPILIHTDCTVIGSEDQVLASSFFHLQGWDPKAVTLSQLLVQNNATGCTMLLNRPLADLVSKYARPEKLFMHDWFIALTAASFGHVIFLNQPLVRYRQHEGNAIGASRKSLLRRGYDIFKEQDKAKTRIQLTYSHTLSFLEAYGPLLPSSADRIIRNYLNTQSLPKWSRISAVRRQGCVMQNPITRLGQILFG